MVQGEDWEEGFSTGLLNSLCIFPLLSYGATAPLAAIPEETLQLTVAQGWDEAPVGRRRLNGQNADWEDNFLKELMIATTLLERRATADRDNVLRNEGERGLLQLALPILVGRPHPEGHPGYPGMGDFFKIQGGGGQYPRQTSPPTNQAVAAFLRDKAGIPEEVVQRVQERSVAETMVRLTALQGCRLWSYPAGLAEAELSREQQDLLGKGYAGPAVALDGIPLTKEQQERCRVGGWDERQLRMLKAMVCHQKPWNYRSFSIDVSV